MSGFFGGGGGGAVPDPLTVATLNATSAVNAAACSLGNGALTTTNTGRVGFYEAPAIPQQTGVAVTAEGIHAALVNLGLITA